MERDSAEYKTSLNELLKKLSFNEAGEPVPIGGKILGLLALEPGMLGDFAKKCIEFYAEADSNLCDTGADQKMLSDAVMYGVLTGIALQRDCSDGDAKGILSALSKFGTDARHTENRAMKAEVFQWLDANMVNFKSLDKAAESITKQQPIAFRTARQWVGDWRKNAK